jgi:hypothetical protein
MGNRYWTWIVVRLLVGVAIVAWAASYLTPGSGEKELQKSLDAMKQVHTFRVAFSGNPGTQHNEMLWEVDCNRDLLHQQTHLVDASANVDMKQDELRIANRAYRRASDGSWSQGGLAYQGATATWYCRNLAQGTDSNLLPPIATMIRRGIIQKGDKKTVNGVRCREWLVAMKNGTSTLAHDTVCLGLDDHLPYEMTVDWEHSRSSFSDYNAPLQIDVPEAAVQAASASN